MPILLQSDPVALFLTTHSIGTPVLVRLIMGAVLVILVVVIGKGLGKHGQVLRGGLVSGHAALGFFFATATFFLTDNVLVTSIGILLAALVAQSRWEAKIHSVFELSLGATVGVILGVLLFGILPQ